MKMEANYTLENEDEDRVITIRSVHDGHLNAKGVFSLTEGIIDRGDIVFDDKMNQWEYTGVGDLTHEEAEGIAKFIKINY